MNNNSNNNCRELSKCRELHMMWWREAEDMFHNAEVLHQRNLLKEAEEEYTRLIRYFQAHVQDVQRSEYERQTIMEFVSKIARRIQHIRSQCREDATIVAEKNYAQKVTNSVSTDLLSCSHSNTSCTDDAKNVSNNVEVKQKANLTKETRFARKTEIPLVQSPSALPTQTLEQKSNLLTTTSSKTSHSSSPLSANRKNVALTEENALHNAQRSAPQCTRTSKLLPLPQGIVTALEQAQLWASRREYKYALDIVQHACEVEKRKCATTTTRAIQPNNTKTSIISTGTLSSSSSLLILKEVEKTLIECRRTYYKHCPAHFIQDNQVTAEEWQILREGNVLDTITVPIWEDRDNGYAGENVFVPCDGVWEDSFTPSLRKTEEWAETKLLHLHELGKPLSDFAIVRKANPLTIMQHNVPNCSIVSSLINCANFEARFPSDNLIYHIIYPQNAQQQSIINPRGKYCVKILLNGMIRMITIDDRLPVRTRGMKFMCTSINNQTELWASLIEKALLKVCGGSYEFPGSMGACDLYRLTGWLPETRDVQAEEFDEKYEWTQLRNAYLKGEVLLGASTDSDIYDESTRRKLMLPANHAYAVLHMKEIDSLKVLLIRNPWGKRTWSGQFSINDHSKLSERVHAAFKYDELLANNGLFIMSWEDFRKYFSLLSLNWNPYRLFATSDGKPRRPTRLACHGKLNYDVSLGRSAQFHFGVRLARKPTRVHVILERHIKRVADFNTISNTNKKKEEEEALANKKQNEKKEQERKCNNTGRIDNNDRNRSKDNSEDNNEYESFWGVKVYDVSTSPSVLEHMGHVCNLTRCMTRRLYSAIDGQRCYEPVNESILTDRSPYYTYFDIPAGNSNYILVITRKGETLQHSLNFTLRIYTELPQCILATPTPSPLSKPLLAARSGVSTNVTSEVNHNTPGIAGVFLHAIPASLPLAHTTTVRGQWKSCELISSKQIDVNEANYFGNCSHVITISSPSLFSFSISFSNRRLKGMLLLYAGQFSLESPNNTIAYDTSHEDCTNASKNTSNDSKSTNTTSSNKKNTLLMRPYYNLCEGCTLDSAPSHYVKYSKVPFLQMLREQTASEVVLEVHQIDETSAKQKSCQEKKMFSIESIDNYTEASILLLTCLSHKLVFAPSQATIYVEGNVVGAETLLKPALEEKIVKMKTNANAGNGNNYNLYLETQVILNTSIVNKNAGWQLLQRILTDAENASDDKDASQRQKVRTFFVELCDLAYSLTKLGVRYERDRFKLEKIQRALSMFNTAQGAASQRAFVSIIYSYFALWVAFMLNYVKRASQQSRPTTKAKTLAWLPAGDYTLIPSLASKDMQGEYSLIIATSAAHKVRTTKI